MFVAVLPKKKVLHIPTFFALSVQRGKTEMIPYDMNEIDRCCGV